MLAEIVDLASLSPRGAAGTVGLASTLEAPVFGKPRAWRAVANAGLAGDVLGLATGVPGLTSPLTRGAREPAEITELVVDLASLLSNRPFAVGLVDGRTPGGRYN